MYNVVSLVFLDTTDSSVKKEGGERDIPQKKVSEPFSLFLLYKWDSCCLSCIARTC